MKTLSKLALLFLLLLASIFNEAFFSQSLQSRSPNAVSESAIANPTMIAVHPSNERIVLQDSLYASTKANRTGGLFVNGGGWQVTAPSDMLVYDLGTYIESGSLEFVLRNFQPSQQNALQRHHFISMYRNPWGNHHPAENLETVWNLHTGFYYNPGVKLLSWTYDENEQNTINKNEWHLGQAYQIKIVWNGRQVSYFRDGELQASHTHSAEMQLRYLFVGRDFTVSGDLLTNYQNNQYPAMVGPIFSNLVIKAQFAGNDAAPPQFANVASNEVFANGARVNWGTNEAANCYVEYGLTSQYGQRTRVLGPPAQSFSTTLADLKPGQTYHYRIVASDTAGNTNATADQIFTTKRSGAYVFKPSADTFVERANLVGTKRDNANFGWMSLLANEGRECYLRFNVSSISGRVTSAKLRLHGRQSGDSGGTLQVLNANWNESSVTWLNKPAVNGKALGTIGKVNAGQWHDVALDSTITGQGVYNFALIGSGKDLVSFDSRESTNHQPELLIYTREKPVALYEIYEAVLTAATPSANPYLNGPQVSVTFTGLSGEAAGKVFTVQGFWDGDSTYRVRFAPMAMGEWNWLSSSTDSGLNGKRGELLCEGVLPEAHASWNGHVHESKAFPYTFAREDGAPFFLLGDTQWSFSTSAISWPQEFQTYVDTRASQGFNYVHGVLYQTYPTGRAQNEGGEAFLNNDVDRLSSGFWRAMDQRVAYMNNKGIVAGMMLAWANDAWRHFRTTAQVERFVQYLVDRYAVYNLFWITAGEYEEASPPGGHAHIGELLHARDPYRHPITTHTIKTSADDFGASAWHTTIYQQTADITLITQDRKYNKPVINSEYGYEGDQSAEDVRKDAWEIVMRGGFSVYGDTNTYHYGAAMTPTNLYSEGAAYMTILKKFWTENGIAWWRFSRFDQLDNDQWLAAWPGFEYVVYTNSAAAFTIDLSEVKGEVQGRWFDTKTGQWGALITGMPTAGFVLTPPHVGAAAYIAAVDGMPATNIENVAVTGISMRRAVITWQTNKPTDAQVEYGLTEQYGFRSLVDTTRSTLHRIALAGLMPNVTYHFRVHSRDDRGNLTTSTNSTFTTSATSGKNAALFAHASASSENVKLQQTAHKAIDGVAEGYPGDQSREWATQGQSVGAWLQLDFPELVTVDHVVLYDRPNLSDQVLGADLIFSDGSWLKVGALVNDGRPVSIAFSSRTIRWLRFDVTNANGQNLGLAEIEVWEEGSVDSSRTTSGENLPEVFKLSPAYPNPFRHETRMYFDVPKEGRCRATIFNTYGQEVKRLIDEKVQAGRHGLMWFGKNQQGAQVSSGIYLLRVEYFASTSSGRVVLTQRLLVMK